jgi:hypothetical protein
LTIIKETVAEDYYVRLFPRTSTAYEKDHSAQSERAPKPSSGHVFSSYSDKKENKIFLIYKEIQMGSVAKSYLTDGLLIYD